MWRGRDPPECLQLCCVKSVAVSSVRKPFVQPGLVSEAPVPLDRLSPAALLGQREGRWRGWGWGLVYLRDAASCPFRRFGLVEDASWVYCCVLSGFSAISCAS